MDTHDENAVNAPPVEEHLPDVQVISPDPEPARIRNQYDSDPDEIVQQSPHLDGGMQSVTDPRYGFVSSLDSLHGVRHRGVHQSTSLHEPDELSLARDLNFEVMSRPENEIEAHRMANNYLFGFRKWKSHVSQRPLEARSEVVQQLYKTTESQHVVTVCTVGNVLYVVLCGWWVALVYLLVAFIMMLTVVGFKYSRFCLHLALYFLWPFGRFVHKVQHVGHGSPLSTLSVSDNTNTASEGQPLLTGSHSNHGDYRTAESPGTHSPTRQPRRACPDSCNHASTGYWRRPETYLWGVLGLPLLTITHCLAFLLNWIPVVTIPAAKIHGKTIQRVLLLPPELLYIHQSSLDGDNTSGDIVMYIYHAVNIYYYKYTVDGMNVFFVNMMFFVMLALGAGYLDTDSRYFSQAVKFALSLLAIIPLSYYIGMGISSLSAQSSYAVGAVLNATFGSTVEIILYLSALYKGMKEGSAECYQDLVKAGLVGTLLATTLLIPGISMVVGGIKHSSQRFNHTSAGVTATLLFVSVAAVFAPSIFSQSYAMYKCDHCRLYNTTDQSEGMECRSCRSDVLGIPSESSLYKDHVMPLVYTCCTLLPLAYIIGLIFSLKTHKASVHDTFVAEVGQTGHGKAQWSRVKSALILLVSVVLMSLCADIVVYNIEPLLGGGVSVYFVGVTLLALIPDIPEIVIGIQFALQNNISLGIEVGSCIAVQVCMLQIPVIVFADLIYSNGFYLLFSEIHIWSVVIGVLLNNYVFQDGKSNYFQGSALVLTYFALIAMYFFAPNPPGNKC